MKHPVMHFEIMGHDAPKLRSFYADVFGWDVAPPIEGSAVEYTIVEPVPHYQRGIAGGIGVAPQGYDGHVTFYVVVDDMEGAFSKIEEHGGSRMMGPDKVPNGPIIGLFRDPEGHTIGLVDPCGATRGAPMGLAPFVFFNGRCQEALEFYKKALGGSYEIHMKDGDKVQYAKFTAPGINFEAADGSSSSPVNPNEGNISLSLDVPDAIQAEEIFRALSDGGSVDHEFGDVEWGGKFGGLKDRFGNEWFVSSQSPVSP